MSLGIAKVRAAEPEDAPMLAQLYVEAFGSKLRWAFGRYADAMAAVVKELLLTDQMRLSETLVAVVEGEVVGMAVLRRDPAVRARWWQVWRVVRRHVRGWRAFTAASLMTAMCANLCTPSRAYLEALAVTSAYRGQGVGSELLRWCIREAHQAGKREISLHVVDTNPRAKQLYERFGFRTVKTERLGRFAARWMGFGAQYFMVRPVHSDSQPEL